MTPQPRHPQSDQPPQDSGAWVYDLLDIAAVVVTLVVIGMVA